MKESQPELSILIATITTRAEYLKRLLAVLRPQIEHAGSRVELLIDCDDGGVSIGSKRQRLLERSSAVDGWTVYLDDDDLITDDWLTTILSALATKPDAVAIRTKRHHDGEYVGDHIHSIKFREYKSKRLRPSTLREYYRPIGILCPVKRSLAVQVGFEDLNSGEDADYAYRLRPLLKTEVSLKHPTYLYFYRSPDQRPGEVTHALRIEAATKS